MLSSQSCVLAQLVEPAYCFGKPADAMARNHLFVNRDFSDIP